MLRVTFDGESSGDTFREAGEPVVFGTLDAAKDQARQIFAGEGDLGDLFEVYGSDWHPIKVEVLEVRLLTCWNILDEDGELTNATL